MNSGGICVNSYKFTPKKSKRFKQTLRNAEKQGLDIDLLEWAIDQLANDFSLPANWKDHPLKGNLKQFRECHIGGSGDWLLVYEKRETDMILYLLGTGSHVDLFGA
jgi:mRNA interferase YafQ